MDDVKIKVIDSDKLVNAINEGSYDVNLSAVMALGAVMSEPQWIPVREKLPERRKHYIVTDFGDVEEAYYTSDGHWFSVDGNKLKDVTAWMPLPEPWKGDTRE